MQRKLSRTLKAEVRQAIGAETQTSETIVQELATALTPAVLGVVVTTHTQFIYVTPAGTRTWPLREVGLADQPLGIAGKPVSMGILAGDELLRFAIPNGVPFEQVLVLSEILSHNAGDDVSARIEILPWWDAKSLWPYATKGRIAGGTTLLEPGAQGSLGVGQRGVSFYAALTAELMLQLPWPEVTAIFVEGRDELIARLPHARLDALGVLQWATDTKGGECFVTVLTKHDELYFAASAPPGILTFHWEELLERFCGDPLDKVEEKAMPVLNSDLVSRLERLTTLHASGSLTDEEFAAAKDALLAD